MKKYIDPASGKLYLLPDENNSSDIVYTVYNDATLNDYTIKNKIENMESMTNASRRSKRKGRQWTCFPFSFNLKSDGLESHDKR